MFINILKIKKKKLRMSLYEHSVSLYPFYLILNNNNSKQQKRQLFSNSTDI